VAARVTKVTDWPAFILANTRLLSPPLVPEIRLHLAEESLEIWRKTEEELAKINVPPPFWAFAWAGGQALARFLLDDPGLVKGKRVLDLGTGCGITAIAAALAGASTVLAADIDAVALQAVVLNAAAAGVTLATTSANLLLAPPEPCDVLLIGDLFYERSLAVAALAYADAALAQGARVLAGDPMRSYFPKDRFERRTTYQVPVTRELEDSEIKSTAVWELRRPPAAAN